MLKSTRIDSSKEGHDVSHIDDTKPIMRLIWWNNWTQIDTGFQGLTMLQRLNQVITSLEHWMAWQVTWQHWLNEIRPRKIVTLNSKHSSKESKKWSDSWHWYDSETSRLPNCKTRRKQVPCSRVTHKLPYSNDTWTHFSHFPQPYGWVLLYFLMSLRKITDARCKLILWMSPPKYI